MFQAATVKRSNGPIDMLTSQYTIRNTYETERLLFYYTVTVVWNRSVFMWFKYNVYIEML